VKREKFHKRTVFLLLCQPSPNCNLRPMGIVREHVAEEENVLFPEAEQMLADQLEDLMDHMVELKQQLTTAPQQ
jgi:hypothetical protein